MAEAHPRPGSAPGPSESIGFQPAETLRIWVVTDGRAGIVNQALGLAEAIARRAPAEITAKRVSLRTPWAWLPPGFLPAPRAALTTQSDELDPPWPDIWIGCGRASLPLSMGVRLWSRARTLVVQLQDPRVNPREFDLVIPPAHDDLDGGNVFPIVGACHRVTPDRVAQAASTYAQDLAALPPPTIALLIGGRSKRQDISPDTARRISREVSALDGSLLVTLSRRTSAKARAIFQRELRPFTRLYFDGEGENPYFAMLGAADVILVTADSANMAVEAAATGKPVLIVPVDGDPGKMLRLHRALYERGAARPFKGRLENWRPEPLRETDRAAAEVLRVLGERRR
ncbi:MAG: mitochondrial fission ELM1 family protein [Hyphomonadaceae bacterium]|nr:mitochondrial fission ELM1 family protein [Hyphomonadaceae bacterium]